MTHHLRPSSTLADTTFHVVDGTPAEVLAQAQEAAQGGDVRLGGGATVIREFLDAGLVDTLHVVVHPMELGSGSRLWGSPDELLDRLHRDVVTSPSGVVHRLLGQRAVANTTRSSVVVPSPSGVRQVMSTSRPGTASQTSVAPARSSVSYRAVRSTV